MHLTSPSSLPTRSWPPGRRRMLCVAFALPWTLLVAGCGQKGPLYHPPPEPGEEKKDDKTGAAPSAPGPRVA